MPLLLDWPCGGAPVQLKSRVVLVVAGSYHTPYGCHITSGLQYKVLVCRLGLSTLYVSPPVWRLHVFTIELLLCNYGPQVFWCKFSHMRCQTRKPIDAGLMLYGMTCDVATASRHTPLPDPHIKQRQMLLLCHCTGWRRWVLLNQILDLEDTTSAWHCFRELDSIKVCCGSEPFSKWPLLPCSFLYHSLCLLMAIILLTGTVLLSLWLLLDVFSVLIQTIS